MPPLIPIILLNIALKSKSNCMNRKLNREYLQAKPSERPRVTIRMLESKYRKDYELYL